MKITKATITAAEVTGSRYKIQDKTLPGFFLLVGATGSMTYYVRYRTEDGIQRDYKLGRPETMTPDQARKDARQVLASVDQGKDPGAARHKRRAAPNLGDLAKRYMEEHGSSKRSGHNDEILWRLHLLPSMGKTRVQRLSHEEVKRFHSNHPLPSTANRALEVLSKAMDLAKDWGWLEGDNPCARIKAHPEVKRKRYLSTEELERLRAVLEDWTDKDPEAVRWRFAQMIRLLLLTGARLRNIMEARWEWLSWNGCVMTVPLTHHKTGEQTQDDLVIHLSEPAMRILHELKEHNPESPWIIPSSKPEQPLSGHRKMWLAMLDDAEIGLHSRWGLLRIHDLRHSFASFALSSGMSLGIVGQLLGHQSQQSTSRYAHLMQDAAQQAVGQVGQLVRL